MDKLDMRTKNIADENYAALAKLFPNALTEKIVGYDEDSKAIIERAIDVDVLRQEISCSVVEGREERYQFTWPGKKSATLLANAPLNGTLRPYFDESRNFGETENLYIEGDNLEVLKLLQETYLDKVKCIYIDPPYNTGKDFVYEDDFATTMQKYVGISGQYDDYGNRLVQNTEGNGRFHSDWLSMIYSRLKLAKNMLKPDGVIFISISDIEVTNLRKICDEIFGDVNFVADLIWANKEGGGSSDSKLFRIKHEHILCYAKDKENVEIVGIPISNPDRYKGEDEYVNIRGRYYLQKLGMGSIQYSSSLDYPIDTPDGGSVMPADNNSGKKACWRWSKDKFIRNKELGFVEIKKDSNGIWTVYTKQYMNCDNDGNIIERTQRPMGIIEEYSSTQAAKQLENMGLGAYFNYSKPVDLIKYLLSRIDCKNEIVMDFFSGSASTAHAVMQLNAEDAGNRKYVLIQLPEKTDEKSKAYNDGYMTICDIGKARIVKAGDGISTEKGKNDIGFRVLKLDSSNMKDVYYNLAQIQQQSLFDSTDNIKEDRTSEDLLFQVMLDLGVLLSSKIEEKMIVGKKVFNVADGFLIACFDSDITEETVKAVAQEKPYYAVFRDSCMVNDSVATNFEQIFATYSPETVRKVL